MNLNSKNFKKILLLVFLSAAIVCAVFNVKAVMTFFGHALSAFSPVIAAFCIAFVLNVLLRGLENKVFRFMDGAKCRFVRKLKRPICLVLTYIIAFGAIALLVLVIIPEIITTLLELIKILPQLVTDTREWVVDTAAKFDIPASQIPAFDLNFDAIAKAGQRLLAGYSGEIVDGAINITTSVIGAVFDIIFSLVLSIYILAQKERIGSFVKKIIDSFVSQKRATKFYHLAKLASDSFTRFIGGQLIEALILGVLCYVGMLIFGFPNAAIISVFICITALVPIIGAFAGIALGFLLILLTSPVKALLFVVFMLILQQIEGNLIYPRVVGKAVGLPSVIVISAVLVGGNCAGILGALLGVPVSAWLFVVVKEIIDNHNAKKTPPPAAEEE